MSDHWKSLADLLGAPGLSSSPKTEPTQSSQPAAAPQAITPAQASAPAPEPPVPEVAPEPPTVTVEAEPTKPKKRSSWEALASLFNIGGGSSEPPAQAKAEPPPKPVPAPEPAAPAPELSLFKPAPAEQPNTALTEMFGETSSKPHESWGKPRRMVNDVDWEDEDPVKPEPIPEVRSTKSLDFEEEADVDSEASDEEPVRRSRRRRRRGRGGRTGDETRSGEVRSDETRSDDVSEEEPIRAEEPRREGGRREGGRRDDSRRGDSRRGEGRRSPRRDDDPSREAAKSRTEEPESRWGRLVGDDEEDDLDLIEVEPTSVEEVGEDDAAPAERRSRRRRRRRGRGRSSSDPAVASDDSSDDVEEVNRGLLGAEDETDSDDDVFGNPEVESDSSEASGDVKRRRRRKRGRGGKRTEEPRDDVADEPIDGEADGFDADLAGDEESGGNKHRNIPTWEDSLASIIEANIENHRRNEGRGGGGHRGGGGRPRGRR